MFRSQIVVVHARWLNHHETLIAVHSAGISKRVENKPPLYKFKVGVEDGGTKFFKQHVQYDKPRRITSDTSIAPIILSEVKNPRISFAWLRGTSSELAKLSGYRPRRIKKNSKRRIVITMLPGQMKNPPPDEYPPTRHPQRDSSRITPAIETHTADKTLCHRSFELTRGKLVGGTALEDAWGHALDYAAGEGGYSLTVKDRADLSIDHRRKISSRPSKARSLGDGG